MTKTVKIKDDRQCTQNLEKKKKKQYDLIWHQIEDQYSQKHQLLENFKISPF